MAQPGRNDPCPCGSGKKYKKCCLVAADARAASSRPTATPTAAPARGLLPFDIVIEDDDLDALSNRAVDLIDAGELDKAERVGRRLLYLYPQQIDGLERLGAVSKARGEHKQAADYLRRAAAMASTPDYDQELIDSLLAEANELDPPTPK